jgi:hypothetical protein
LLFGVPADDDDQAVSTPFFVRLALLSRQEKDRMLDYPRIFFVFSFFVLWIAAQIGSSLRARRSLQAEERADFDIVQTATLTLLALIIGFSFSMATSRYDLRKTYEEAEANAIGTEYVRAGLLPPVEGAAVRAQLRNYLDLRISFYKTRNQKELARINADTAQTQTAMWSLVQAPAMAQSNAVVALAVSGMNDVLNSQGYTQAAWWNRIPHAAWILMVAIAICGNVLVGYGERSARARLLFVLPLVISISFLLIADIDSPRGGFIHVFPQNLASLSQSLPRN